MLQGTVNQPAAPAVEALKGEIQSQIDSVEAAAGKVAEHNRDAAPAVESLRTEAAAFRQAVQSGTGAEVEAAHAKFSEAAGKVAGATTDATLKQDLASGAQTLGSLSKAMLQGTVNQQAAPAVEAL